FFLMTIVPYQTLSVPALLVDRVHPGRRPEIGQYPRAGSFQKRDALQHGQLVFVHLFLRFFAPGTRNVRWSMIALLGLRTKFRHDQWLIEASLPFDSRGCSRPG